MELVDLAGAAKEMQSSESPFDICHQSSKRMASLGLMLFLRICVVNVDKLTRKCWPFQILSVW